MAETIKNDAAVVEEKEEESAAMPATKAAPAWAQEILSADKEILRSLKRVKRYFHWRVIWIAVKWAFLVLIVILGFISFRTISSYLQGYVNMFNSYGAKLGGQNFTPNQ